jgi:hypothetical protein
MHAYAACSDPEICAVVRANYRDLIACAEKVSGLSKERISSFFAAAMLLSVLVSMQVQNGPQDWAAKLLEGCAMTLTGPPTRLVGEAA